MFNHTNSLMKTFLKLFTMPTMFTVGTYDIDKLDDNMINRVGRRVWLLACTSQQTQYIDPLLNQRRDIIRHHRV